MIMVRALSLLTAVLLLGGAGGAVAQRLDRDQPPAIVQSPQKQEAAQGMGEAEPDVAEEAEPEPEETPVRPRAQPTAPQPQRPRPPPTVRRVGPPQQPPANAPVRTARPVPPRPVMTAPAGTDGVPPLDELVATRERPLFSSTRRPPPPVEEPEVDAPITEAKSMSFELVGVVRSDENAFAILRNTESKEETRVPKGQKFGAWTIEEVHDRSIVLAGEARRIRMRLFDESKSPGISIRKVGGDDDDHAAAVDDGNVDEDVAPSASPEGRPATAQPVQRRVKGDNNNMTPAQRRKARLQQQQQRRQLLRNNDE